MQLCLANRHKDGAEHQGQGRKDDGKQPHRPSNLRRREARGVQNHQLSVGCKAMDHIDHRGKSGDWGDCKNHPGQGERGELQKDQGGLAIGNQPIKQAHRAVNPIDQHQDQRKKPKHCEQLLQNICVDPLHMAPAVIFCSLLKEIAPNRNMNLVKITATG